MALEDLPFDDLRDRAFSLAHERNDRGFFFDLYRHSPAVLATGDEGGSLGEISGTIIELVTGAREVYTSDNLGDMQPLFVARFATYLRDHGVKE